MRCFNCQNFSLKTICDTCALALADFECGRRNLGEFGVYYFYKYELIKHILHTKHHLCGSFVLRRLAAISLANFARTSGAFAAQELWLVPLDDKCADGYSHTAILARALQTPRATPLYAALRAKNAVKYAGQSLQFRQSHPRGFALAPRALAALRRAPKPVVLIDDIVTSGTTLKEAAAALKSHDIAVAFAITLADAAT